MSLSKRCQLPVLEASAAGHQEHQSQPTPDSVPQSIRECGHEDILDSHQSSAGGQVRVVSGGTDVGAASGRDPALGLGPRSRPEVAPTNPAR